MKRERVLLGIAGLFAAALLVSCNSMPSWSQPLTSFQVSELSTGTAMEGSQALEHFEIIVPVKRYFGVSAGPAWLGGTDTVTLVNDAIAAEISRQGGTQAVNITVGHEAKMTDIMVNGFTCFIYAPSTVRIAGTVLQ